MYNPLMAVQGNRGKVFVVLLICTTGLMVVLNFIGTPLITEAAPNGIISYELAGSVEKAQQIINSWNHNAQLNASFSLGLDYLFLFFYSTTIALACIWAGDVINHTGWPIGVLGVILAWLQWFAALMDIVENNALTIMLLDTVSFPWPQIAMVCASIKFGLILIGMIYAFYGLCAHLARIIMK